MEWRPPSGKTCDRKVETSPEEMNGACLADKAAPEEFEDAISLHQCSPKGVGRVGVVRAVYLIHRKGNRVVQLVRHLVYCDRNANSFQEIHDSTIEVSDRLRLEGKCAYLTPADAGNELVAEEIELDIQDFVTNRNR